ncbi:MAG: Alpha/beta hydrolase fold-3 domain protein [Verrucomicrobia bacterium]|jgi:acetyl esterase/lipase|nr:Alpha/beta hydrolase fold-3 domain protein [Verrucomicrobiota bacterium]
MRPLSLLYLLTVIFISLGAIQAHAAAPKPLDPAAQIAAKVEPTRKVVYKQIEGRELRLHIFEPKGLKPGDKRPCFLTIHGGGWRGGEPRRMYPFAAHYAELGMVGISMEYRLVTTKGTNTVFDCVKDGRSALRYIRAHAKELGIDPERIAVNGGSAGGHVAASTAMFEGIDEAMDDLKISSVPNAMVLYYPVIDTSKEGYGNALIGARWQEISPAHQVKRGTPPTLILHGTGDTTTPFKGAQKFHDAMLKAGNRSELVVNEGGPHGYLMFDGALFNDALVQTDLFLESLGWVK